MDDALARHRNSIKEHNSIEKGSTTEAQSDVQTVNYWRAIVTEDECSKLDKANFPYDKSRKKLTDGRIPIRFKVELKQEYQKIISSSATIKVGGKVGK